MDNETALEKARALCSGFHAFGAPCARCHKIAAALRHAYADGLASTHGSQSRLGGQRLRYAEAQRIRKEADQLEGK